MSAEEIKRTETVGVGDFDESIIGFAVLAFRLFIFVKGACITLRNRAFCTVTAPSPALKILDAKTMKK